MKAKGNPLGSNRAESDIDMLGKAFIETSDYHTMANGPAYNAVVGRRGAGKSALFWRLTEHFKERADITLLAIKPRASTFTGLAGTVHRVLGDQAGYAQARETMRHGWRATFYAHLLGTLQKTGLPPWLRENPLETALALIGSFQGAAYQDVVYNVGRAAEQLEPQVQQALRDKESRGVVLIDGIDEGWIGAAIENGILGGLAAAAADLQDHEAGVRLVIFIRDNMYRILGEHDPDFSRILAGDSLRLDWNHESLLELVAARIRLALSLAVDMSAVEAWNRFAKTDLKGKAGFHAILKHTLYRPRDVLELLNRAIQIAQRQGREALTSADVDVAAREISVSRYQDLQKEYASVLPGISDLLSAFSGRPAICTVRELASWLSALDLGHDAAATAARLGGPSRVMQALFGVGFIGVEESAGAFRFCHDGSDAHLDQVSEETRVVVHPCYHRALDVVRSDNEPLDVLLNASFEYGEGPSNTAQVAELVRARARDLIRRLADIQVGQQDNAKFEAWARDALEFLFQGDLKNIVLKPTSDAPARRDIVASNEATHGPWRRIADTHGAHQVVFEVKNFEQLQADAYQQVVSYMGTEYGSAGFIVYRAKGPNPDGNERGHLATHKIQSHTVILLPESLLQRLLKKQSARDILDKFGAWYDNHLRKWCLPKSSPRST